MIVYEITMSDNFATTDFERAAKAVNEKFQEKDYKIKFVRENNNITFFFASSLHVVLLYLEYLLESSIQLDLDNKVVQNGTPTNSELISRVVD